jgi:hypothetical protein
MTEHLQKKDTSAATAEDATFADADDPRRTDQRGGLAATLGGPDGQESNGAGPGRDDLGTTDAAARYTGDSTGAAGSGRSNNGQVDLSTTGMVAPDSGPAATGPVEGGRSGATEVEVEMTDVGLVDVNSADNTLPGEAGDEGARVEDAAGNLL